MSLKNHHQAAWQHVGLGAALLSTLVNLVGPTSLAAKTAPAANSPIKHVIVIIGENRSFDHVYATYKPKAGQNVSNLLSRGIIKADGTEGVNFDLSAQYSAVDTSVFQLSPTGKAIYGNIPEPAEPPLRATPVQHHL
jgi:phospholipase C